MIYFQKLYKEQNKTANGHAISVTLGEKFRIGDFGIQETEFGKPMPPGRLQ